MAAAVAVAVPVVVPVPVPVPGAGVPDVPPPSSVPPSSTSWPGTVLPLPTVDPDDCRSVESSEALGGFVAT